MVKKGLLSVNDAAKELNMTAYHMIKVKDNKYREPLISETFAKLVLRKGELLGFHKGHTENNEVIRGTL